MTRSEPFGGYLELLVFDACSSAKTEKDNFIRYAPNGEGADDNINVRTDCIDAYLLALRPRFFLGANKNIANDQKNSTKALQTYVNALLSYNNGSEINESDKYKPMNGQNKFHINCHIFALTRMNAYYNSGEKKKRFY